MANRVPKPAVVDAAYLAVVKTAGAMTADFVTGVDRVACDLDGPRILILYPCAAPEPGLRGSFVTVRSYRESGQRRPDF